MSIIKRLLIITAIAVGGIQAQAQVESANAALLKIYKTYDSLAYLTFDVRFVYDTDTIFGHSKHDELKG